MSKEIRFGELVKASGRPEIVSLWADPRQNRSFMKAVKENRVLTLTQEPASKRKDFGRIGFHQEPHAAYLVFPKPLPRTPLPKVTGIKYELVEQPRVSDPINVAEPVPKQAKPLRKRREPKRFEVLIRRSAVIETVIVVEDVANSNAAKREALQQMKREPFEVAKAILKNEALHVKSPRD